ncbi:MAG TPA: response regulator [bacterium]|mgnify:FL=1|nr:response regulator [bacterium]
MNILLVDDDNNLIKPLVNLLENYYTIKTANTLKEAREIVKYHYIDIVLLDINLPDGSGIAFLDELMNLYPDIIVIMATANDNIRDAINCVKKRGSGLFSKTL